MISNQELTQQVLAELKWDPRLANADIGVAVDDGIVTLSGFVGTHSAKAAAVHAVERLRGVRAVVNELDVRHDAAYARTDKQVAEAALHALKWDVTVPDDRIQVRVEHGWVILDGEVDWHFQRQAAEQAVRSLYGIKGVTNRLRILQIAVPAAEVKRTIESAIRRCAEEDARHITVETHDGTVILRGTVRSWAEREQAETAAWNARGTCAVDNRITIAEPVST